MECLCRGLSNGAACILVMNAGHLLLCGCEKFVCCKVQLLLQRQQLTLIREHPMLPQSSVGCTELNHKALGSGEAKTGGRWKAGGAACRAVWCCSGRAAPLSAIKCLRKCKLQQNEEQELPGTSVKQPLHPNKLLLLHSTSSLFPRDECSLLGAAPSTHSLGGALLTPPALPHSSIRKQQAVQSWRL